jgi:hypothetical protein
VNVIEWPVHQQTIEEYFSDAEDLPISVPAPVSQEPSVRAPATRNLTLLEIRQRRKENGK